MAFSRPATASNASVRQVGATGSGAPRIATSRVKQVYSERLMAFIQPISTSTAALVDSKKYLQPTSVMQAASTMQPTKSVRVASVMQPASVTQQINQVRATSKTQLESAVVRSRIHVSVPKAKDPIDLQLAVENHSTLSDLKQQISDELSKQGGSPIAREQLLLTVERDADCLERLDDDDKSMLPLSLNEGSRLHVTDFTELREEWTMPCCKIQKTEERGITLTQLRVLWDFIKCRSTPTGSILGWYDASIHSKTYGDILRLSSINLYHASDWLIKPSTKPYDCSLVELMASHELKQRPQWFVSHFWGEAIIDFTACISKHVKLRCLSEHSAFWVCAYANNQHELGQDLQRNPRATSFFRAMRLCIGVLVILDDKATPFQRIWCCFEESIALTDDGREEKMKLDIATSCNGEVHLLTDGLTPAEEIEENTYGGNSGYGWISKLKREEHFPLELIQNWGFSIDIENAKASVEMDRVRILNSIAGVHEADLDNPPPEKHPKYQEVSRALRAMFAIAAWPQVVNGRKGELHDELACILRQAEVRSQLELSFYGLGGAVVDNDLRVVGRALGPQLSLLRLSFEQCFYISNVGVAQLSQGLPKQLNHLDLSFKLCQNIDDAGIAAVSQKIPASVKHLRLDFGNCARITNSGIAKLANCLPQGLTSFWLSLAFCQQVSDLGIAALAQHIPASLQNLSLDVKSTNTSEALIKRFRCHHRNDNNNAWRLSAFRMWNPSAEETCILTDSIELVWQLSLALAGGLNLEEQDACGNTPLLWAATNNHINVVGFLLRGRADVEAQTRPSSMTSLGIACKHGNHTLADRLLEAQADTQSQDVCGLNALHWAARNGHQDIATLLIEKKASLESVANNGQTPLIQAALHGQARIVQILAEKKAYLDAKGCHDFTSLHFASKRGHLHVAALLLHQRASINAQAVNSLTALHFAALQGHVEVVKLLTKNNADIDIECSGSVDPLHWVVYAGKRAHVERTGIHKTAKRLAEDKGNHEVAAILNKEIGLLRNPGAFQTLRQLQTTGWWRGSREEIIELAQGVWSYGKGGYVQVCMKGDFFIIDHPLAGRVVVAASDFVRSEGSDDDWSLLWLGRYKGKKWGDMFLWDLSENWVEKPAAEYLASWTRMDPNGQLQRELIDCIDQEQEIDVAVLRQLLNLGASANVKAEGTEGATLLHWAAYKGQVEILELLFNHGVMVNAAEDTHGLPSPLHLAVTSGQLETVRFLVGNRALLDMRMAGEVGLTVLELATMAGEVNIGKFLAAEMLQNATSLQQMAELSNIFAVCFAGLRSGSSLV